MIKKTNMLFLLPLFCIYAYADKNKVELSYVDTSGNTNTTTLSAKLNSTKNLNEKDEIKLKASALYAKSDDETSANQYQIEIDYNHMIDEKWYSYMGANYINDELSDYDYRLNVGPGIGYKFINTDNQLLDLQGGIDYAFDKYENGDNDNYFAGRTELNYMYKFNEKVEFNQMLSYLVSLEDNEKYFAVSDSALEVKMTDTLSMGLSYKVDYTNKTQEEKTDRKFLTSLIINF